MKKVPVEPVKYIECTEVFDIQQEGNLSNYIKIMNIIHEKYPNINENDIRYYNDYLGNHFTVPFTKINPNYDRELTEYNLEIMKFLKKQFDNNLRAVSIISKKEEKEKRRQERIAKNQLLKTISENKTIEIDNKKYKVQLIEVKE